MPHLHDDFSTGTLAAPWTPLETGGGRAIVEPGGLRLHLPACRRDRYSDAQITDYGGLARRAFPWRPPLRMTVRAYASGGGGSLRGTAGFGFWNDPFNPVRREIPRLPRAAWFFFGSPPNNMALALGQPGHGWKAATFDALRPLFLALLPAAPLGLLLMRIPALYRALWPVGQRALGIAEQHLPPDLLAESHEYALEWRRERVTFWVDGAQVLTTPRSPRGPLGFIAWIDNQYAVVTPQGRFGWGFLESGAQWLQLEGVAIEIP